MPIEIKRPRSENSDQPVVVGTIQWTPDDWDYKTDDSDLSILLDEVMTKGTVIALSSVDTAEGTFDFVEEEVDVSDIRFISGLSTYLEQNSNMWIGVTDDS